MQLYYAMGGGMGHLARAAAFIYTQKIAAESLILLTSSPYATAMLPNIKCLHIPHELTHSPQILAEKISQIISEYNISIGYIDAFPMGIVGEWAQVNLQGVKLYHLARLLNWDAYRPFWNPVLRFANTYICEPLTAAHENDLRQISAELSNLTLIYSPVIPPFLGFDLRAKFDIQKPLWLIVHSENEAEIQALYDYAQDIAKHEQVNPTFVLITAAAAFDLGDSDLGDSDLGGFDLSEQVHWLKHSAAYAFFPQADKIFTAAGFNLMQQLRDFRERHHILPFHRTFDNQFLRLKRWKDEGKI